MTSKTLAIYSEKRRVIKLQLPPSFETTDFARSEDELRVRLLRKTIDEVVSQGSGAAADIIDLAAAAALAQGLERGLGRRGLPKSLASAGHMRKVRQTVICALLNALEPFGDDQLRVVTVINEHWRLGPKQLNTVNAAGIKRQFRTHLSRGGVFTLPGFTIGFLHGEFEPTSERWQLHYHLVTTTNRADALYAGLRGRWGYTKTATGAAAIKRQRLQNRTIQLSYLLKSYWPAKPVVPIDGVVKRVRDPRRIGEPYHSNVLVWLHAQRFSEMMVMNGCDFRGGRFHLRQ